MFACLTKLGGKRICDKFVVKMRYVRSWIFEGFKQRWRVQIGQGLTHYWSKLPLRRMPTRRCFTITAKF
jgi:hypothetical protein